MSDLMRQYRELKGEADCYRLTLKAIAEMTDYESHSGLLSQVHRFAVTALDDGMFRHRTFVAPKDESA
jgi:hypothetical protein